MLLDSNFQNIGKKKFSVQLKKIKNGHIIMIFWKKYGKNM
jgi:hypothetical protein